MQLASIFNKINKKYLLYLLASVFGITAIFFCSWLWQLNQFIEKGLREKKLLQPINFYAAPEKLFIGQNISSIELQNILTQLELRNIPYDSRLHLKEFKSLPEAQCKALNKIEENITSCIELSLAASDITPKKRLLISFKDQKIIGIYRWMDSSYQIFSRESLAPKLFAQYYNNKAILIDKIELGDSPPYCLNSLLAIEDAKFLEHKGFSLKSILRAIIKNLQEGRKVQGGSTITQQLVKNYFLSHEKTYKRKFKELFMAILLESKANKDDILQSYINEIYMGQNGVFQIRGFAAAAKFYFQKALPELNLPECALLSAIVNSPGKYNPYSQPEKARSRRELVLKQLKKLNIISEDEFYAANKSPLPRRNPKALTEPAPYFMDSVYRQIKNLDIELKPGLKIYTTMNLRAQAAAEKAVKEGLQSLESWFKHIHKIKNKGKNLQGILLAADPENAHITALVGGRDFKSSPYNRALLSHRQVGSIMKAFVFLSALESFDSEGKAYTPLSPLMDQKFTVNYEGQKWSPKNFKNQYYGQIPMFFALKNSLNTATASLAMQVGIDSVVDIAHRLGVTSEIQALPSLSLGAYELYPIEVLQAYTNFSRFGKHMNLKFITHIISQDQELIYQTNNESEQVVSEETVATLVGMMKQTVSNGSGASIKKLGFLNPAAGKTGTTSNSRDAWFGGFTPYQVAVTWIGYDDNTSHGLTGATGAIPLWLRFMKSFASQYPAEDFSWPANIEKYQLSVEEQKDLNIPNTEKKPLQDIELIFRQGNSPSLF